MAIKTLTDVSVAEAYLTLLAERGIDYLFANPGSDFGPIIEALAKAQVTGTPCPTPITCPHENVAMHMAVGHYMVSGRTQAVMVHTNVGTANGMLGILNATRGSVPMLFSAGRTPFNEDTFVGHRDVDITWAQEMYDQAGMVREGVKWDYELRNIEQLETVVDRALSITRSEPLGPVYLVLPREVIARRAERFSYTTPAKVQAAARLAPDPDTLQQIADLLSNAEAPLIITSGAGRALDVMAALAAFAERCAIPVVQFQNRLVSMPSDHPMNLGYDLNPLIGEADVVLVLDSLVPWLPHRHKLRSDAVVVQMAPDPLYRGVPIRGHQSDITISSSVGLGLRLLDTAVKPNPVVVDRRRKQLAEMRAKQLDERARLLEAKKTETPIHPAWISHCVNELKDDDTIIVSESGMMQGYVSTTQPATWIKASAGSGLGAGTGTALGAKLAAPDRLVIGAYGDGSYIFGNPVASHFVSAESNLPLLHIVFNNSVWKSVRNSTQRVSPDGYAEKSNRPPLTALDVANKYEKVVEAADGYGERVSDPAKLMGALERARKVVEVEKRQALLNVICS